jgi:hypothetical protein
VNERPTEPLPVQPQPPPLPSARLRRRRIKAAYFAAGAGLVALLVALVFVVIQLADFVGRPGAADGPTPPTAAATPSAERTDEGSPQPTGGLRCEAQAVRAPDTRAWRMATRRGDIQLTSQAGATRLTFRIYRGGRSENRAEVAAELVPSSEVESRFGVQPPGDGAATLVVTFSDEFRFGGDQIELGRVGSVAGVVISSQAAGAVAVVGLGRDGCYELQAPDWDGDTSPQSADVFIDIEN